MLGTWEGRARRRIVIGAALTLALAGGSLIWRLVAGDAAAVEAETGILRVGQAVRFEGGDLDYIPAKGLQKPESFLPRGTRGMVVMDGGPRELMDRTVIVKGMDDPRFDDYYEVQRHFLRPAR